VKRKSTLFYLLFVGFLDCYSQTLDQQFEQKYWNYRDKKIVIINDIESPFK